MIVYRENIRDSADESLGLICSFCKVAVIGFIGSNMTIL